MRCYELALERIVGEHVPTFGEFGELSEWLNARGFEMHLYHVPGIPLKDIPIDGYAVVTQLMPDQSRHASLTFCGLLDHDNGRQFSKPDYPVTLITILERISNVATQTS